MTEKRLLALLGFLLGLVSFALILVRVLEIGGRTTFDLAFFLNRIVTIVLAVAVLLGSLMIYRGSYMAGGIVNFVIGLVLILWAGPVDGGVLAILSGVLGFVAETARS